MDPYQKQSELFINIREELSIEVKRIKDSYTKSMEKIQYLNSDIAQLTIKYKENEQKFKDKIQCLELRLKNSQSDVIQKLKDDNVKLMFENTELFNKYNKLMDKANSYEIMKKEIVEKEKIMKHKLKKEFNLIMNLRRELEEMIRKQKHDGYHKLYK